LSITKRNQDSAPEQTDQAAKKTDEVIIQVRIGLKGQLPIYASAGSAGCDLFAAQALVLRPGETRLLPLDLVMALEPGVEAQIRPRSGLSLKTSLRLPNSPGTIDSDFRNEVCVLLENTSSLTGIAEMIINEPYLLRKLGDGYSRITLGEYWRNRCRNDRNDRDNQDSADAGNWNLLQEMLPEISGQTLYVDELGNPFGTIYIKPGDRIAQMVFCRYQRAVFVDHPSPEAIGSDRGGGFGSTGT
jgi:dUTP pyrophosphatase